MAGLKGLDASSVAARQGQVDESALREFIGGAPVKSGGPMTEADRVKEQPAKKPAKGPKFVRTNFSLSDKTNKQIDQLSLAPRTFKVNRSDVVRAGVAALRAMPRAELVKLLATVVGADESDEGEQRE